VYLALGIKDTRNQTNISPRLRSADSSTTPRWARPARACNQLARADTHTGCVLSTERAGLRLAPEWAWNRRTSTRVELYGDAAWAHEPDRATRKSYLH